MTLSQTLSVHLSLSLSVCGAADSSSGICSSIPPGLACTPSVRLLTQLFDTFVLLCGAGVMVDWLICCDTPLPVCQSHRRPGGTMVALLECGIYQQMNLSVLHVITSGSLNLSCWLSVIWGTLTAILQTAGRYAASALWLNSFRSHSGLLPSGRRLSSRSWDKHLNNLDV